MTGREAGRGPSDWRVAGARCWLCWAFFWVVLNFGKNVLAMYPASHGAPFGAKRSIMGNAKVLDVVLFQSLQRCEGGRHPCHRNWNRNVAFIYSLVWLPFMLWLLLFYFTQIPQWCELWQLVVGEWARCLGAIASLEQQKFRNVYL